MELDYEAAMLALLRELMIPAEVLEKAYNPNLAQAELVAGKG